MDWNDVYLRSSFLLIPTDWPHFTNSLTRLFWVVNTMAFLHGSFNRIPHNSSHSISILLEPLPSSVVHLAPPAYDNECHYNPHQTASTLPMCLPQGIRIVNTGPHQFTVVSYRASISKGTRFGPYRGRVVQPWQVKEGEDNEYLWEVSIVKPPMSTKYWQWFRSYETYFTTTTNRNCFSG